MSPVVLRAKPEESAVPQFKSRFVAVAQDDNL